MFSVCVHVNKCADIVSNIWICGCCIPAIDMGTYVYMCICRCVHVCSCIHAHLVCTAGADAEIARGGFVQHELLVRGKGNASAVRSPIGVCHCVWVLKPTNKTSLVCILYFYAWV